MNKKVFKKNNNIYKKETEKGISIIETLIVFLLFSIIGIFVTRSIFVTLRSSKKSQSIIKVRDNINYSISIIQRQLRGAQKIETCPNEDTTQIDYIDSDGGNSYFKCNIVGSVGYIASGSARLTSDEINITSCSFLCTQGSDGYPSTVVFSIDAEDALTTQVEQGRVTTSSTIYLRNY